MPNTGMYSDVFLDVRAVRHRVLYSITQIARLEAGGEFPGRIRIGKMRVAWSLLDILTWMQSKIDRRSRMPLAPVIIGREDRFIGGKELLALVPFSLRHVLRMEGYGTFPGRIEIGPRHVAWLEREVREWMAERREEANASPRKRPIPPPVSQTRIRDSATH